MVALVKEDGSEVVGSNTYADESDLSAYAEARGITITGTPSVLLIKSMDYIEKKSYKGYKVDKDQPTQFPRHEISIAGHYYVKDSPSIFRILVEGQCRLALAIDSGYDPLKPVKPPVKRKRIEGAIDITYHDRGPDTTTDYSFDMILSDLYSSASNVMAVDRA